MNQKQRDRVMPIVRTFFEQEQLVQIIVEHPMVQKLLGGNPFTDDLFQQSFINYMSYGTDGELVVSCIQEMIVKVRDLVLSKFPQEGHSTEETLLVYIGNIVQKNFDVIFEYLDRYIMAAISTQLGNDHRIAKEVNAFFITKHSKTAA